ncbi:MAG: hypothetical protein PHV50_09055 [Syntrophaceticus sp.]|jgi:hypothetical protein|nr:hypothetical protein [Desulfitobacteriaceae bacterium]MDD4360683.1 hypothetical protein [Syntrophaceticus sp.]MDD4402638.1 hypothetical protein [Desulfitobacteriaceae bacterium]
MSETRQRYDDEFKKNAVKLSYASSKTVKAQARILYPFCFNLNCYLFNFYSEILLSIMQKNSFAVTLFLGTQLPVHSGLHFLFFLSDSRSSLNFREYCQ